jgi:ring-1,2-phenylacetyl-CoA epoxidase subunit PaaC
VLAAVAAKGVKEVAYHRDHAGRWVVTQARGTDESRRRLLAALDRLWPLLPELTGVHPIERRVAAAGAGVDPSTVEGEVGAVLAEVFAAAGVDRPGAAAVDAAGGRDGRHTAALAELLAELQEVARAHPEGTW